MRTIFLGACLATTTACANLNTINRATSFPLATERAALSPATEVSTRRPKTNRAHKASAKAVHLDIQQRLFIMNEVGVYCAEPSPDGLAAYAAAVGLGASNPTGDAISASGSGGSVAASVGLRSQTITLMRDAMYRVCEAYANEQIGSGQVATLLGRSQDLTAVILAVEQLTGPLTANQAYLATTTDSTTSASLVATARQLELAIEAYNRASARVTEAEVDQAKVNTELAAVSAELTAKETVLEGDNAPTNATERAKLVEDIALLTARQSELQQEQRALNTQVASLKEARSSAERTRDTIAAQQETAFASASAGTSSSGAFGTRADASKLSTDASIAVANAVKEMVTDVVGKSYITESCLSVLTGGFRQKGGAVLNPEFAQSCLQLVQAEIDARAAEAKLAAAMQEQSVRVLQLASGPVLERVLGVTAPNEEIDAAKRDELLSKAIDSYGLDVRFADRIRDIEEFSTLQTLLNGAPELSQLGRAADDILEQDRP